MICEEGVDHPAEQQWIRQAQAGDREAFAALVGCYWPRINRWLYGLTQNTHTAEELTQEVFLKAWTALRSFSGTGFRAWLFTIAGNALIDLRRSPKAAPTQELPESLSSNEPSPAANVVTRESLALVLESCARLPEHFRAPLLLRTQEDLSFAEIAKVLGIREVTVRWRIFRARLLLMNELKDYLDEKLS